MFNTIIIETFYYSFMKMFESKTQGNMIIEPMSCLIKLALLNFYPKGTKITVQDNQILFDEPTFYQGAIRYLYKQGREDLHNLFNPIQKSIDWYTNINSDTEFIFNLAIDGLGILKDTYTESSTIKHTLNYYIKTLEERNIKHEKNVKKDKLYDYLKNLWNTREIHIVRTTLEELSIKQNDDYDNVKKDIQSLLDSLFSITNNKEENVKNFLKNYVSVL